MKKLIIIFALLISVSISTYSAAWLKLTGITFKYEGMEWTPWETCDIDICFDVEKNSQIIIYSKEAQIFYVDSLEKKETDEYNVSAGYVYDKSYKKVYMTVYLGKRSNIQSFIAFEYPEFEYIYSIY